MFTPLCDEPHDGALTLHDTASIILTLTFQISYSASDLDALGGIQIPNSYRATSAYPRSSLPLWATIPS
jgi:hypothetical protein